MVNRRDLSFKRGPSPKVHHEHNWPYDVLDQSHDDISMSDQSHCSSGQPVSMGIGVNWVSEADDEGSSSMAAISCDDYSSDLTEDDGIPGDIANQVCFVQTSIDETIPSDVANQITFVQTSMEYAATLWQFLLELLLGGGGIPDNLRQLQESPHHKIIAWTNMGCDPESPKYGEFKLIDSETVAMLWGRRKNKPRMNYDKLSRALRYYYEKDIIRKVSGQKFVYQFGRLPDREHQLLLNETFRNSSSPHMTVVSVGGDPIAANGQRYLYVPIKRLSPESGDDGAIKVEDQPLPDINNHNQPSTSAPDPEMTSGHMPLVTAAALLNMRPAIDPALIMRSYAQYMRCILEARSASSSSSTGVRADIKMEALDYSAGAGMDVKVEPDEYTNVDSSNIKTDSVFNDETVDENDEYGDLCIDQSDSAENDCEIDVKRCHQDFSPGDSRPYQNSDQKNVPISKPGDVITLWQFLLEQLIPSEKAIDGDLKPLSNLFGVEELESDGRVMVWTSPDHANPMSEYFCEFRISDPDKLAAMWGARKNTPRMNYEKMARSLRFYYKKGILRKVRGQKFVYQFTKDEQQRIIVGKTASDCGVVDQQEVSQSPLSEVDQQTTKFV